MVQDSLWHNVSKDERDLIKNEAKKILSEFASKLEKIKSVKDSISFGDGTRLEGEGWKTDQDFKDLMFLNAPFVEDNFIVAEKGSWKK